MTLPFTIERAKWEVCWVNKRGEITVVDCDTDFAEARRLWLKAKQAGKKMATLRSKNCAFPPPDKYADHHPIYKRRKGKVVKRKGKPVIVDWELSLPRTYRDRMRKVNIKGVHWCPYCCELRHFERRAGFISDTTEEVVEHDAWYCPICEIPHTNGQVMKYNPILNELQYRKKTRGRSSRGKRRKRR